MGMLRMLPMELKVAPDGRTRPRIVDLLHAAKNSGSRVAGIINADCMIIPQGNLAQRLTDSLDDGLVIVERANISRHTLRPSGQLCWGFDAFFFTVDSLDKIEWDDHWYIGAVWWDYWLPIAFLRAQLKVKTLPAPMLLHLDHEVVWSRTNQHKELLRLADDIRKDHLLATDLLSHLSEQPTEREIDETINKLYDWLRRREHLWTPEYEGVEDLFASIVNAIANNPLPRSPYRAIASQWIDSLHLRNAFNAIRRLYQA
jgi:hypothetical protein